MAGSYAHVVTDDGKYRGTDLLDNMGDMDEAVDQMAFMLLTIQHRWGGDLIVPQLAEDYCACVRGEKPWPAWWTPEEKA